MRELKVHLTQHMEATTIQNAFLSQMSPPQSRNASNYRAQNLSSHEKSDVAALKEALANEQRRSAEYERKIMVSESTLKAAEAKMRSYESRFNSQQELLVKYKALVSSREWERVRREIKDQIPDSTIPVEMKTLEGEFVALIIKTPDRLQRSRGNTADTIHRSRYNSREKTPDTIHRSREKISGEVESSRASVVKSSPSISQSRTGEHSVASIRRNEMEKQGAKLAVNEFVREAEYEMKSKPVVRSPGKAAAKIDTELEECRMAMKAEPQEEKQSASAYAAAIRERARALRPSTAAVMRKPMHHGDAASRELFSRPSTPGNTKSISNEGIRARAPRPSTAVATMRKSSDHGITDHLREASSNYKALLKQRRDQNGY